MDPERMTLLKDALMSMTPDDELVVRDFLEQRRRQAEAQALAAQLPDRGPTFTFLTRKRHCPETGTPLIGLTVLTPDGGISPEYVLEVPTAEGLAQHLLQYAGEHRQKYGPEWFNDPVTPVIDDVVPTDN
jgi:hypothetical protein